MLIILEGPDGSGKSTLARSIVENLVDAELLHKSPPKFHPLIEYETPLFGYRPGEHRHVVCDRWHVGEWVYPQVMRRKTVADDAVWAHIELFLQARGAVQVLMPTLLHTIIERVKERGDDYVETGQLAEIQRIYNDQFTRVQTAYMFDDSWKKIIRIGDILEAGAAHVRHNGSYVGAPRPEVLLIGERREFAEPYPPAFGPFRATSGHYLLSALCMAKFSMRNTAMANAYEEDLAQLWQLTGEPKVVALGRRAQGELINANVPHGAVPHPQFVRRFYHKRKYWYAGLITRAAYQQEDLAGCRP